RIVAEIFPKIAVELIGSGLDRRIDDASGGMPKLCAKVPALEFELLDLIRWRSDGGVAAHRGAAIDFNVVVDAVETKVVLPEVDAVHRKMGVVGGARVRAGLSLGGRSRTGGELRQRCPVAALERHAVDRVT